MILVDTSVLIDSIRGVRNQKTQLLKVMLQQDLPIGISAYTYLEVLQGAKDEHGYAKLREYLSSQMIYYLPESVSTYEKAARIYYDCRRKGLTIRSGIDVLIALTAIEHGLPILHSDVDFDQIATVVSDLKIVNVPLS